MYYYVLLSSEKGNKLSVELGLDIELGQNQTQLAQAPALDLPKQVVLDL